MDYTLTKTSSRQLLDFYLLHEYVLCEEKRGYRARVKGILAANHGIIVKERDVQQRVKGILAGTTLRPSANVSGTPSSREGKDQNYAGFISLVDVFLPERNKRSYVGLPANQLDLIADKIGGDIVAIEWDKARALQFEKLKMFVEQRRADVRLKVANCDIWSYLQNHENSFNIFDLDLMCSLPEDPSNWASAIMHAAKPGASVINLTTTVGRTITVDKHEAYIVRFNRSLCSSGAQSLGHSRFAYRDRAVPMRCERFVIQK